jgi:hypothetical protein
VIPGKGGAVWCPDGFDASLVPGAAGGVWLGRALARRGLAVVRGTAPPSGIDRVFVGAPELDVGPEAVHTWRRWVVGGSRLLVAASADAGMVVPGFQPDPPALTLRPRARFAADEPGIAGRIWPNGRGWFRFGRSHDVLAAAPAEDPGWSGRPPAPTRFRWVHVALGAGEVLLLGDPGALADRSLADPAARAEASDVLTRWLPPIEDAVASVDPEAVLQLPAAGEALADPATAAVLEALSGPGLPPDLATATAWMSALRVLGEARLARAFGGRVRLTPAGAEALPRVRAVLVARTVLRALDVADDPPA